MKVHINKFRKPNHIFGEETLFTLKIILENVKCFKP